MLVRTTKTSRLVGASAPIKTVLVSETINKGKRRSRRRSTRGAVSSPYTWSGRYASLLRNPFDNEPMRLGFGCLVPTTVLTLYRRGSLLVNADGSFALAMHPAMNYVPGGGVILGPVLYSNAGATTATWAGAPFSNGAATYADLGSSTGTQARHIAGGIRVIPSIAATAAPGELYVASVNSASGSDITTLTPTTISQMASVQSGSALDGASVTTRPLDLFSFAFEYVSYNALNGGSVMHSSFPVIAGTGLPATTLVYYEMVSHFEIVAGTTATVTSNQTGEGSSIGPASAFPNVETFYNTASRLAGDPVELTSRFEKMTDRLNSYSGAFTAASVAGASAYALMSRTFRNRPSTRL